ncbi:TonB family protein [Campylobacter sp. faydin G-140]|uniref:energy transducer TonB family protein n=1 Tax=Campylobacter anatolicus TaxID=2829105 RepID=UPI001BA435C4|nr:energy transducer TonB [Campylobacter anatolicus]MBR8466123.1 TonB family protein [Campylobacter anatolicus]
MQLQQRLNNNASIIGFFISATLHIAFIVWIVWVHSNIIYTSPKVVKLPLNAFIVGGGASAEPPAPPQPKPMPEPTPPQPEPILEPEPMPTLVKIPKPVVEDKIVEDVVKKPEPKKEEKPKEKPKKKPEPKKEPKKEVSPTPTPPKPQEIQVSSNSVTSEFATQNVAVSGNNALNKDSNKVASSNTQSDNPMQTNDVALHHAIAGEIQAIIANYAKKNYPRSSKIRREQGTATVSFNYDPSGVVDNVKIVKSSGFANLDEAVKIAIDKTKSKFPKIDKKTTFSVPVRFSLS